MEPDFRALTGLVLTNEDGMRDGQQADKSSVLQIVKDLPFRFDITKCEKEGYDTKLVCVCVCVCARTCGGGCK